MGGTLHPPSEQPVAPEALTLDQILVLSADLNKDSPTGHIKDVLRKAAKAHSVRSKRTS
jgi:hypothetical protein